MKKIFKRNGWFYRVAGNKARCIDGPSKFNIPPYNEYVILGPKKPEKVCRFISKQLGNIFCIVDANDIACNVLGNSDKKACPSELISHVLSDNPLGQNDEQTPMGIIREIN